MRRRRKSRSSGRINSTSDCRSRGWKWRSAAIPNNGGLALFHLGAETVVAVGVVNTPAAFMAGKMMIARRRRIDAALLRDPDSNLQQLAA